MPSSTNADPGPSRRQDPKSSVSRIEERQDTWALEIPRDPRYQGYAQTLAANLFLRRLSSKTEAEFRDGDGAELNDSRRPAKMRALISSSALAANFFDPWREHDLDPVSRALHLEGPIVSLGFEHKLRRYPVRPRSPNLDLLLTTSDGTFVGIESKFVEPYRGVDTSLSPKYFPSGRGLWAEIGLERAQRVADGFKPEWHSLDVAQLLKHMLGLGHEESPATLLYLWHDTDLEDARNHRDEIARFTEMVGGGRVLFAALTYQEVFGSLSAAPEPVMGWRDYMMRRYFMPAAA